MQSHTTKHPIYWADDDRDDLLLFREIVEANAADHEVVEFTNGKELIAALQRLNGQDFPCLIVLDMNMPVFSGKETLAFLKKSAAFGHIPVVMFTTSSNPADKQFCDQMGTEMFTKPLSFDHLEHIINDFVALCGKQRGQSKAA